MQSRKKTEKIESMDEANVLETGEADTETLEEKYLPVLEDNYLGDLGTTEEQEDESGSVVQPLLQHQQQHSRCETHKPTDGADQKTSVPQELELDSIDQPQCIGSVRSLGSDSSAGRECPICSEPFDSQGDRRIMLLNCDHTLCRHCLAGILKRAKDPSRVQCPFCRQNTPLPQWEIQRMQEEAYSNSVHEPGPAAAAAAGLISPAPDTRLPEPPAPPSCCFALEQRLEEHTQRNICGCCIYPLCLIRVLRLMRQHSLCCSITALLLFLMLMGCFPVRILSIIFSDG